MFTVPADLPGGEDRLELVLVARLVKSQRRVVVARGDFLADRDGRALRVMDDVVFDDPALGPVRPDQTRLVGCRRGPGPGSWPKWWSAHHRPRRTRQVASARDSGSDRLFRSSHRSPPYAAVGPTPLEGSAPHRNWFR